MGLSDTPQAERLHIGIFGKRNSGKSSLINALTNQDKALVSDTPGTTADPVFKAMELHPVGPVVFIDTAGFDDVGDLGELRVRKTRELLLSRNGIINGVLDALGLPAQDLANSSAAIVIGMVYDYLPFMILPVYNAVCDIKDDIIEAARDLGAPPAAVLTRIMIPLTRPGIISGITMVFVPSLTAFAIPDILGGGKVMLIGNIIEQEFSTSMNWHLGSGLSIALMIFVLISMIFTSGEQDRRERRVW